MRKFGGSAKAAASAMALGLSFAPVALTAQAQTVPDFRIPGARPTSDPRAQGPVDTDAPIIRSPAPRPTPSPTPVPVASPTPTPSAPVSTAPVPRNTAASRAAAAQPRAVAGPPPSASAAPSPGTQAITPFPLPVSTGLPTVTPTTSLIEPTPASATSGTYWPWIAGAVALLAAAFAALWWRRRQVRTPQLEFIPPVVPAPAPPPAPRAEPQPAPAAEPVRIPEPQLSAVLPGLGIALEARRMSASLMATTLSYTLTLTNNSPDTLSALAVEGDMIAAHASLPPEQQIASDGQRLELRHALVTLGPGESAEFKGDFRLPLSALNPIRAGDAAFFVPLARLRVEASTTDGQPVVQVQTYVVGETSDAPGTGLRPFRLDLGPRTYSQIGQRAVN